MYSLRQLVADFVKAAGSRAFLNLGYYSWDKQGLRPTKAASGESLCKLAHLLSLMFKHAPHGEILFIPLRAAIVEAGFEFVLDARITYHDDCYFCS